MRPGPQRGVLMIGTRVCTKSIRFLHLEKKKEKKKKRKKEEEAWYFPPTSHHRCSASQRRAKYSSLLSCEVHWGDFCGWLLTLAFGAFLCQTGVSAGAICLSITATSQCSLRAQITLLLWGCTALRVRVKMSACVSRVHVYANVCVCVYAYQTFYVISTNLSLVWDYRWCWLHAAHVNIRADKTCWVPVSLTFILTALPSMWPHLIDANLTR